MGHKCEACDLSYEERYGPIGADLIHVHHVMPLSQIGERYQADPIRDLVTLCANCQTALNIDPLSASNFDPLVM
ncbi:HNH endonuclease [Rhizobium bangladeshense]|uniref:HNH endonuclease n=1 Tax=Rhizobium bangladeshense TaxID=1138189 RepID=UPI001C836E8E